MDRVLVCTNIVVAFATVWNAYLTREAIDSNNQSSFQTLNQMRSQGKSSLRNAIATNKLSKQAQTQSELMKNQLDALGTSADAAKSAAATASKSLEVGNRPWVKITHRLVKPLDFNFVGGMGPAASMVVEDTLENVGQTVALHVLSWEDIIPIDADYSARTALARQKEWCDANRNSAQTRTVGSVLFPHALVVQNSGMAALMTKINAAVAASPIKGKVGFAMVGCVVYRSSFEPLNTPNHQTRFIYDLGIPEAGGVWMPYVFPTGIASELRLISTFRTFTAD